MLSRMAACEYHEAEPKCNLTAHGRAEITTGFHRKGPRRQVVADHQPWPIGQLEISATGDPAPAHGSGVSMILNSTRRFAARPSSVSLLAIGLSGPKPRAWRRSTAMPLSVRYLTTACARRWLRSRLYAA